MDIKEVVNVVISADGQAIREENVNSLTQENVLSSDQAKRICEIVNRMKKANQQQIERWEALHPENANDPFYQAIKQHISACRQNYSSSFSWHSVEKGIENSLTDIVVGMANFFVVKPMTFFFDMQVMGGFQEELDNPLLSQEAREVYEKAMDDFFETKYKEPVEKMVRAGKSYWKFKKEQAEALFSFDLQKGLKMELSEIKGIGTFLFPSIAEMHRNWHELSEEQRGELIGRGFIEIELAIDLTKNMGKLVYRPSRLNLSHITSPTAAETSSLVRRNYVSLQSNHWLAFPTHKATHGFFSSSLNYTRPTTFLHPSLIGEHPFFIQA